MPARLRLLLLAALLAGAVTAGTAVAGLVPADRPAPPPGATEALATAGPGERHDADRAPSPAPEPSSPEPPSSTASPGPADGPMTADALVAGTLAEAGRWVDVGDARAAGYRSIGDGATGHEHLVHPARLLDEVQLDPSAPESLVYRVTPDGHQYVSAMYVLRPGTTMADVPDLGDDQARWHVHDDLCFSASGTVAGRLTADGCRPGGTHVVTPPMLHVWVVDHPCGRFAPLEGHGGRCEHRHG